MKAKGFWIVLLCLLLCGCSDRSNGDRVRADGTSGSVSQDAADPQETDRSMQTKLQYYEELVKQLQEELLQCKTERYVEQISHEAAVRQLEQSIAELENEKTESDVTSSDPIAFTYRTENGTVTLLTYTGAARRVEVPSEVDGFPVTVIGDRAFQNCSVLEEVILPDGIESIGWFAFSGCISLRNVRIPHSVTVMCYGIFENCSSALTVKCPGDSYAEAYAKSYGIRTSAG